MRNPNGYGSTYKLSGKRRRPWIAVRSEMELHEGKARQKRIIIGYFEKREDAMNALAMAGKNEEIERSKLTLREAWEEYQKSESFLKLTESSQRNYRSNLEKQLKKLMDAPMRDISARDLQREIDAQNNLSGSKKFVRSVLKMVYRWAMAHDICDKDASALIETGRSGKKIKRRPFADSEIKVMLDNYHNKYIAGCLVMIYTSMRIGELCKIKKADIDLQKSVIIGGSKTAAGKNRIFPVAEKIKPVVKWLIDSHDGPDLMGIGNSAFVYGMTRYLKQLGLPEHTSHDCRHTFFTLADRAGINPVITKTIGGHSRYETTEKIYIHKNPADLVEAVQKL